VPPPRDNRFGSPLELSRARTGCARSVGGGLSVMLEEAGRQLAKDAPKRRPSTQRRRPAGASARDGGSQGKGRRR